jgi:hypothetical protein
MAQMRLAIELKHTEAHKELYKQLFKLPGRGVGLMLNKRHDTL